MSHYLSEALVSSRVVAILRGLRLEVAVESCEALAEAGVRFMEVPLNTEGAVEVVAALIRHFKGSDVHIGAGTVLTPEQVDVIADAGGEYIVSPNTRLSVISRTVERGLLSMPGFATPSEAFDALDAGASVLKAFPCGSPENIWVLKSVIKAPVFAFGGIDKNNKRGYLDVTEGVGVGVGIFNPAMSPAELLVNAREFMAI